MSEGGARAESDSWLSFLSRRGYNALLSVVDFAWETLVYSSASVSGRVDVLQIAESVGQTPIQHEDSAPANPEQYETDEVKGENIA